ncbi:MAG: hypothetical protein RL885_23080 [Planctomycetota bacterium]
MMNVTREPRRRSLAHRRLTLGLQAVIAIGIVLEVFERQWLNVLITSSILLLTALPALMARRFRVIIPTEFELMTIAFIFAALFLGETRDYYGRFWWWDLALHGTSGGLLGILGILLVYLLNENPRIDLQMQPGFVAFFAFCFSVAVGALWEIFEFGMDELFGMNMQKAMLDDPSGLTDTMWDLIVDSVGAGVVALLGYWTMKRGTQTMVERWIRKFITSNPRLFTRR